MTPIKRQLIVSPIIEETTLLSLKPIVKYWKVETMALDCKADVYVGDVVQLRTNPTKYNEEIYFIHESHVLLSK